MNLAKNTTNNMNRSRTLLFKSIAILLPFFILVLVEISLRIASYGNDLRVFKTDKTGKFYYLNPQIGKRYFTNEINATNGNMDFFRKEKTSGTFRIFVLGGSTALGFPYLYNGAFPQMLKYQLQRHYPDLNIEMINLSLTAINSYAVFDISKEVIKYQPDAVLIYTGQNEYHGTLGVASSSRFGNNPFLINLIIQSKKLRLVQLVFNTINSSEKSDHSTDLNLTLMERLASGQKIPFNSEKYWLGIRQFERNINKIVDLFSLKKIPVFIGTLVTNKRGIHPFISEFSKTENTVEWNQLFDNGKFALQHGDTIKATEFLTAASELDSTFAECQFRLGEISFAKKDYKTARKYYTNAKELDQLRFRAPEAFNDIIEKVAGSRKNIYITDVAAAFDLASPHQIVGEELLHEHVHPNLSGYYLMADTYYKAISAANLIPKTRFNNIPAELIKKQMPLTQFDTVYGYISNILLKENWPFNEPLPEPTPAEKTYEGKVAGGLAVRQYSWKTAMEKLFNYYFKKSDFANALRIAEGQSLVFPFNATYLERATKLAQKLEDDDRALLYLTKIWNNFNHSNEIAQQLLTTTLNSDQPKLAIPYLNYLILNSSSKLPYIKMKDEIEKIIESEDELKLSPENLQVTNRIVASYIQVNNYKSAQKYINLSLTIDPGNTEARNLQIKINQHKE